MSNAAEKKTMPIEAAREDNAEEAERLRKTICSACQGEISDKYIMRVANRSWHAGCLRCCECGCQLTTTCFFRSGLLHCSLHGPCSAHCSGCDGPLKQSEYIHQSANYLYHVSCFHCISCGQQLEKGDNYYQLEDTGKLMCKIDYDMAHRKDYDNGNKRPRTTISSIQLEALKKAYRDGSKPPRVVREKLAKQTGLDSRVVQVWFQNRRAKEKRVNKDHKQGVDNSIYESMLDETLYIPPLCLPSQHPAWPSNIITDAQLTFPPPNIVSFIHNLNTASTHNLHMSV